MDRAELISLFHPLYDEAKALAEYVFQGKQLSGNIDTSCAYLVKHAYDLGCSVRYNKFPSKRSLARQIPPQWDADWLDYWHLPEPFNGDVVSGNARIAFVGLNPSISWTERCPTFTWAVGDWIDYYLERFDAEGHFRQDPDAKLYLAYQEALDRAATGEDRLLLGTHAVITEVVQYKAKKPFGEVINRQGHITGNNRGKFLAAATHCRAWTKKLLVRSGVDVVVAVGRETVEHFLGQEVICDGMKAIQGYVYRRNGLRYVTTKHPTGDWTWTPDDMTQLAAGIKEALLGGE